MVISIGRLKRSGCPRKSSIGSNPAVAIAIPMVPFLRG